MRPMTPTPTPMPTWAPVLRVSVWVEEDGGTAVVAIPKVPVDIDVIVVNDVVVAVAVHCGSGYIVPLSDFLSMMPKLTSGEYTVSTGEAAALGPTSNTKRHELLEGGDGLQLATQKRLEPLPELAVELTLQTRVQGGAVPFGPSLHSR